MQRRTNKIILKNFSFSVGELVIEQSVSDPNSMLADTALKAIGQVISAPQQLIGLESKGLIVETPESDAQNGATNPATPKARRRRTRRQPNETTASSGDQATVPTNGGGRSSGSSTASPLILEMKTEGFFAQDRSIAEIREELHTKGHSFDSNELSPILLSLTRKRVLSRQKNDRGQWIYRDGTNAAT